MRTASFVINLDRVPERFRFVEKEATQAGLALTRWRAVDAAQLADAGPAHYLPGSGTRWTLSATLIACFESHRRLWNHIVAEDLDLAAVFEDDILLTQEAGALFADLFGRKPEFDILKLDTASQTRRFGAQRGFGDGFALRPIEQTMASAAAYVVSREGARRLVEASRTYSDHLDDFVFKPRAGWTTLQLFPAIACQGMFVPATAEARDLPQEIASSERTGDPGLNHTPERPPRLWRLKNNLRRELTQVSRRLWRDRRLLAMGGLVGQVPLSSTLRR